MKKAVLTTTAMVGKSSKSSYYCHTTDTIENCSLAGYGSTPKEAMDDMLVSYEEIKEINTENGLETPALKFSYKFDLPSFFAHFKWINVSKFAEIAGINASLLRQYVSGSAKASDTQLSKINSAINRLSKELNTSIE